MNLTRGARVSLWGAALALLGVVIGMIVTAIGPGNALDRAWMATMVAVRTEPLVSAAHVLDWIGGGWRATLVVPAIVIVVLAIQRRPWAIAFFAAASLGSVVMVQTLKSLFARARPEDMLVTSDFGSFPSGHVANATTLAVVLILLTRRVAMTIVGVAWVLAMAWSRTYLGAHWLTDTMAGMVIGTGAALIMWGVFSARLEKEASGRDDTAV